MVRIVPLAERHHADWERLFAGYAAFYKLAQTPEMRARVWNWLQDPAHAVEGLAAEAPEEGGRAVGLAHFRAFARPSTATTGGFLDDLFVDPGFRGGRVADALIERLAEIGRERGWSVIRWITADNNYRARGVYDRLAQRTMWVTYDIKLG
jgi:GNAT superfamily N-acetyltransferase